MFALSKSSFCLDFVTWLKIDMLRDSFLYLLLN